GIRDLIVTGVQTCALPICEEGTGHSDILLSVVPLDMEEYLIAPIGWEVHIDVGRLAGEQEAGERKPALDHVDGGEVQAVSDAGEIGRASCRERVCVSHAVG